MKLLMGAILILSVAAIFTGAIVSFAQILTEVFSVNFSPMGLIP